MIELPRIMVSPTGARRSKADHPNLPMSEDEIVTACVECEAAGAGGVHLHIRDEQGRHSIDAVSYQHALVRLAERLPEFFVQVTSESAGRYAAQDQRELIHKLRPTSVSVALREFLPDNNEIAVARDSYHWAHDNGVHVHHICYSRDELARLLGFIRNGTIPGKHHHVQLVLGSYDGARISRPEDVADFASPMINPEDDLTFDWMMCAFGVAETDCLARTIELGGKARIGFENSIWHRDGRVANNNAERVSELICALDSQRGKPAT